MYHFEHTERSINSQTPSNHLFILVSKKNEINGLSITRLLVAGDAMLSLPPSRIRWSPDSDQIVLIRFLEFLQMHFRVWPVCAPVYYFITITRTYIPTYWFLSVAVNNKCVGLTNYVSLRHSQSMCAAVHRIPFVGYESIMLRIVGIWINDNSPAIIFFFSYSYWNVSKISVDGWKPKPMPTNTRHR